MTTINHIYYLDAQPNPMLPPAVPYADAEYHGDYDDVLREHCLTQANGDAGESFWRFRPGFYGILSLDLKTNTPRFRHVDELDGWLAAENGECAGQSAYENDLRSARVMGMV